MLGHELTFRRKIFTIRAGSALHIPANAPYAFGNASRAAVWTLAIPTLAGLEEFLLVTRCPVSRPPDRLELNLHRRLLVKHRIAAAENAPYWPLSH